MSFEIRKKILHSRDNSQTRISWEILLNGCEYACIHSHIDYPEYWFWSCNDLGVLRERLVEKGDSDTLEMLLKHLKVKISNKIQKLENLKYFISN